jgi:hypothetical protein
MAAMREVGGEARDVIDARLLKALNLGYPELVRTAQRRGAIEHYYRAVARPFFSARDWAALPASAPPRHLRRGPAARLVGHRGGAAGGHVRCP